jgi:TrmH family RNA methyltransferase
MKRITSRQNALVSRFRAVANGSERRWLLLDGAHLISDAVDARLSVSHAIVASDALARPDVAPLVARLSQLHVELAEAPASVLAAASPVRSSSAIVALAEPPAQSGQVFHGPRVLVPIACDVQDPGNLGAIVRVAEAAGASGLIAAGGCANPYGWKVLRGSMGSAFRLPVRVVHDPREAVTDARAHRCRIVATAPRGGRSLFDADLTGALALLIGGEGHGLDDELLDCADERVTIPMRPPVESLNAAVTAALVLYEAGRSSLT